MVVLAGLGAIAKVLPRAAMSKSTYCCLGRTVTNTPDKTLLEDEDAASRRPWRYKYFFFSPLSPKSVIAFD